VPLVGQNLRTEQVAVVLFSLLKKDAERGLGEGFTMAIVTIPANRPCRRATSAPST